MSTIIIGEPFIVDFGEYTRLCADVEYEGDTHELYYETETKYGQFLTTELSDCFVVTLLLYAMEHGADILCEGAISERLHYQLENYLIPVIADRIPDYSYKTRIIAKDSNILFAPMGVGTGLTCGVDSFYTVLKNLEHGDGSDLQITHLCFFNAGSNGSMGGRRLRHYSLLDVNTLEK